VDGKNAFAIVAATRGKSGSQVTLTLQRNAASAARKVVLTRETIRFTAVKLAWQEGNVLVVRVPQFRGGARNAIVREIEKFSETSKREPEGLVLDLRDNQRGVPTEAFGLATLFLPVDTTLGSTRGRARDANFTYKAVEQERAPQLTWPMSGAFKNAPMAVLVNGNTGTAAEALAAALQANGRALVAGFPTSGAGALPAYYGLGDSSVVRVTKVYWYTPKNVALDRSPLIPDVRMPDRLAPGAWTELGPADEALHETVRALLARKAKP
jgi:carboxyl-terminal processing protease